MSSLQILVTYKVCLHRTNKRKLCPDYSTLPCGETAWEPKFHYLSNVTGKRVIFILLYSVDAEEHISTTTEI